MKYLITLLFLVTTMIFYSGCQRYSSISLGKYKWVYISPRETEIQSFNGKVLVGPGTIDLYAKYPFIFGYIANNGKIENFIIDMENDSVKFLGKDDFFNFLQKIYNGHREIPFMTFFDLRGQYSSLQKMQELQSCLRAKE